MIRPTAIRSVAFWRNCSVDLIKDGGTDTSGRWVPGSITLDASIPAKQQRAKAAEIKRFERGGERLENATRLYLQKKPSGKPDFVILNGTNFKVYAWDFRDDVKYWRLLIAEAAL